MNMNKRIEKLEKKVVAPEPKGELSDALKELIEKTINPRDDIQHLPEERFNSEKLKDERTRRWEQR